MTFSVKVSVALRFLADGRLEMLPRLLPGLVEIYKAWEASSYVQPQGCFYSGDTADGGEDSISGDGCRVSINAIMVEPGLSCCHLPAPAGVELVSNPGQTVCSFIVLLRPLHESSGRWSPAQHTGVHHHGSLS